MIFVSMMADNMNFFYAHLIESISRRCGVSIGIEDGVAWQQRERMLDRGEAHLGVICGLPYVWKVDRSEPLVELVAAPVMKRTRYRDRPVYFSDVIVRGDRAFRRFADLRGASWAYNEPHSHSGYNLTRFHLGSLGERAGFFGQVVESGAHQTSIQMVVDGAVDASAIDSTVLELECELRPRLARAVRIVHTFGPSPAPPVVVSTKVSEELRRRLRRLILSVHHEPAGRELLARAGIARFAAVSDSHYDPIRRMAQCVKGIRLSGCTADPMPWRTRGAIGTFQAASALGKKV